MAYLRLLFCTRMKSQSTIARTPVLHKVTVSRLCLQHVRRENASISPFQRGQTHDVQTGDALPSLLVIHLAALPTPRALNLMLVPHLVVVPDLRRGERPGSILLVGEQEQRDAKDLRRRQDRV